MKSKFFFTTLLAILFCTVFSESAFAWRAQSHGKKFVRQRSHEYCKETCNKESAKGAVCGMKRSSCKFQHTEGREYAERNYKSRFGKTSTKYMRSKW
jgi:hypothetical protein